MNRTFLYISLLVSLVLFGQKKDNSTIRNIDSLTKDMRKSIGLITTYSNEENTLYFEISDSLLNKEILMVTRFAQIPGDFIQSINAGKKTAEQVIRFNKKGKTIQLKQIKYSNVAEDDDPIKLSVTENNFPPILAVFDIKNTESERYLIDVSSHFMNDSPGFNILTKSVKEQFKIGSVDKKRSSIDEARSYPVNTEILHTLSFRSNKATYSHPSKTFSFQINHSLIALPEDPMPVRYADHRVGWFKLRKINYSSPALKADQYEIIKRWRLEPVDPKAYLEGKLVEPKKPIIYYLDPATPLKWRKYFKLGIEDWNKAFEKAGFKNAIIAKDPPSLEEDPNFSPEDIRYSTVRYIASIRRNATGPRVTDPRTGEILESDILWYHNHLRSYRNRFLLETGAANPKARTLNPQEDQIGEMIRQVIAHEVGHALGLPHNMKASSAYAVDSLRSSSFTHKYGVASSIMDYARFNYVAQPEDKNIRFIRKLGPYDEYAIEWGYRYFPEKSPKEIKKTLLKMVNDKSRLPLYMFGNTVNDPNSLTENIGDDVVKASSYGLKNLKIVASNLAQWIQDPNQDFTDLKELHGELFNVYRRYIFHVYRLIGGVNETLHNQSQKGIYTFQNVDRNKQINALDFLKRNLWESQKWLMKKELISQISNEGKIERFQNIQRSVINGLLSETKLNQMISSQNSLVGQALTVKGFLQKLCSQIIEIKLPDLNQKTLQIHYLNRTNQLIQSEQLSPVVKTNLIALKSKTHHRLKKMRRRSIKANKAHYDLMVKLTSGN